MKRVMDYYYNTYDIDCDCCSERLSGYTMWEDV